MRRGAALSVRRGPEGPAEAQAVAGLSAADREALRQLSMRVKRNLDVPGV